MTEFTIRMFCHLVVSTKGRQPLLTPSIRPRLYSYLKGLARDYRFPLIEIGGTANHVHILLMAPTEVSLDTVIMWIKSGSSRWMNMTFPSDPPFRWQEGYAIVTIGESEVPALRRCICNQEEHHRTESFEDEYRRFLTEHGIEFDEDDLFD